MNIGLLGGTFDPPHVGHLIVAEHAREQLRIDSVLFVPACVPPHKQTGEVSGSTHRFEMVQASVRTNKFFEASTIELDRGGVSYTVDTLRTLSAARPGDRLFLFIGTDMLSDFRSWRSWEEIVDLAEIVALMRPEFPMPELDHTLKKRITNCRIPQIDISSSDIRRRVREGKSIRFLVLPAVESYIREHRLYR